MLQNTVAKTHLCFKIVCRLQNADPWKSSGLLLKIEGNEVWVKLIGNFNAYNVLAIYGTAIELGLDSLKRFACCLNWKCFWRFQYIVSATNVTAIVDYAHTPMRLRTYWKR
jgi:UDP-N-acetylmuramoyl-L-alanyl-D-glutamate--2,6-diaminopimelate ligase